MTMDKSPSTEVDSKLFRPVSVSVFFPCYNEQDNIVALVEKTIAVLEKLDADFELIIVDDGSSDSTARIADEIAQKDGRVKVIHHEKNLGYGEALKSGFKALTSSLLERCSRSL